MTTQQAFTLALQHHQAGQLKEAETLYRQILAARPDHADALHHLGIIAHQWNRHDLAAEWIGQSLVFAPNNPAAHSNLGEAYRKMGRLDEAIAAYHRALDLMKSDHLGVHSNLGLALAEQGQLDQAIAAYHEALQLNPDFAEAHYNLGAALARQDRLDEAVAAFRRALQLKPDYSDACLNLGSALSAKGQGDEAITAFRRALELKPSFADAHSNLILATLFHPASDRLAMREECQRWDRQHAQPLSRFIVPHGNARNPSRPLRIGYVSPAFRDDVVGRNLAPLFRNHDRREFEILCYSGGAKPDHMTEEFLRRADRWRSTAGVSDETLAKMIREDGVDILVDIALHTAGNRLLVFARQPAPIQVSFAGYPESTGLEAIGHRISDRYLESENAGVQRATEEHISLIDSFWCYDPCGIEAEINRPPAQENGWVTFGCSNNFCKINKPVLKLWARVLRQVNDSRLVLLSPAGSHRQRALDILLSEGIEAHRVEFVALRPRQAYLELYHRLDIALDPFPYNGHTTSLDALWMGVPVISLVGEQPVCRAGWSQLSNLGLPELAAFSAGDYATIATQLARDLPRLTHLRSTLRPRMEASLLMDAPRFTREIESAYRTMWQSWCAKDPSPAR